MRPPYTLCTFTHLLLFNGSHKRPARWLNTVSFLRAQTIYFLYFFEKLISGLPLNSGQMSTPPPRTGSLERQSSPLILGVKSLFVKAGGIEGHVDFGFNLPSASTESIFQQISSTSSSRVPSYCPACGLTGELAPTAGLGTG